MKKNLFKITLGLSLLAFSQNANAQCPEITCIPDITASTDSAMCDAIVTYALPTAIDTCLPASSQTFTYTGAQQTFVVPAGVTSISVDAYGAQGGSLSPTTNVNYGGRVQADLPVTPGTTIYVYVGEQPTGVVGGFNGGGTGETAGIGGGGATDLRIGGTTYNDRVIVAGAGGGGGTWNGQEVTGGAGGDLVGGNGYRGDFATAPGGEGGTQTLSGNGTCISLNNPACSGGFGFGGTPTGCGCQVYGGGGGWYGGAGSGNCRGGGGGSSYTDPTATNVTHTQGVRMGNGEITITWAGGSTTITQIAGLASGATFPIGTTTNTFIAESNGGVDTCSFDVIVVDNQAPTVTCPSNVDICEGGVVSGTTPSSSDNCAGETVTYNTTGATVTSGAGSVDGVSFNTGTTTVWYIATDASGNQDSCSFDVTVNPLPTVSLAAFSVDSICDYNSAIALPAGSPVSGTYTGAGVSGTDFDPSLATAGDNIVTYTYTDSLGCENSATASIYVDACVGMDEFNPLSNISVFPNPSNGLFTVSFGDQTGELSYSISAADGRTIKSDAIEMGEDLTIDLSSEPNGVYLLQMKGSNSTKTMTLIKD